jgi:hypothetical protein
VRLGPRQGGELAGHRLRNPLLVAEQPDRPQADVRVRVVKRVQGQWLVEAAAEVQAPKGFKGVLAVRPVE